MLCVYIAKGNAHQLLEAAIRRTCGWGRLPEIIRAENGKPLFAEYPEIQFNLSHSGPMSLCAVSDHPVGVDLELLRPRRPELPARFFQGALWERYLALGGDWPAFFALWTEIESIVKYTGEGLRAWREARVPEECVITNLTGMGWQGAVCSPEPFYGEPEFLNLAGKSI